MRTHRVRLASTAAAARLASLTVVPQTQATASTTPYITDDQGRVLFLHGLNTASSDDVAREARDLGTNSVRYLRTTTAGRRSPRTSPAISYRGTTFSLTVTPG